MTMCNEWVDWVTRKIQKKSYLSARAMWAIPGHENYIVPSLAAFIDNG